MGDVGRGGAKMALELGKEAIPFGGGLIVRWWRRRRGSWRVMAGRGFGIRMMSG